MSCEVFKRISAKLFSGFLMTLVVIALLNLSATAYAVEITYKGDGKNLQNIPSWPYNNLTGLSLYPGLEQAPMSSGNKITMDYVSEDYVPDTTEVKPPGFFQRLAALVIKRKTKTTEVKHPEFVCGGISEWDDVVNNQVILLNGHVKNRMSAGKSINSDSIGNKVIMSGGSVGWGVVGGESMIGTVVDNKVNISGGSVRMQAMGGFSEEGVASGNNVTISGGSVRSDVSGARSCNGNVIGNTVTISGGDVGRGVEGGYCIGLTGDAMSNTVNISGGLIHKDVYGGASSGGSTMSNTVNISGGLVHEDVYGGASFGGGAMSMSNTVNISGGSFGGGGRDSADSNTVNISGGFVGKDVYNLNNRNGSGNANATGNTITISGKPNLAAANISGGYKEIISGDVFTSNTLNLKSSGIVAKSVRNFEYYNFSLPGNLVAGGVMLSVTETVNLKGAKVKVSLQGVSKLREGNKITLIKSAKGVSNAPKNKSCKVKQRGLLYEFSIYTDSNNLWAKVTKVSKAAK